ncbi:MAG TPA: LysR family transcriptional regulator [Solirubrobacteraceae bacterium]|nr:LysR family transcriptional regulator [Solirubrobacteraceae bacterium]
MSLELRHLRCFVAVAEHGQISAAAEALHVAQPAVSQTIRQLERVLGVTLFDRTSRGVKLTAVGADILPQARAALQASQDAVSTARAHVREEARRLAVGFLPPLTRIAAEILSAFEQAQPIIEVDLRQVGFGLDVAAVRRREVDLALVWAVAPTPEVALEILTEEPRVVCLAADNPLAAKQQLSFAEVEDLPVPGVPAGFSTELADYLHLTELRRRPAVQADVAPRSLEEIVWLITSGRSICLGPASLAELFARPGIAVVPLAGVDPVPIALAHRTDDRRPAVRAFSRLAREYFRASPDPRREPAPRRSSPPAAGSPGR